MLLDTVYSPGQPRLHDPARLPTCLEAAEKIDALVTIEEGSIGGFGAQ